MSGNTAEQILPMLFLLFSGCGLLKSPEEAFSNVEIISMRLPNDGYTQLGGATYLNDWISAEVKASGRKYEGRLQISGNITLRDVKKSYRLDLHRGFEPGRHQHQYVLSAQSRDESFIRYRLASHFFKKAGFHCSNLRPVELFINNELHGLYLEREPVDSAFFLDRGLPVSSLYKIHTNAQLDAGKEIVPEQIFEKKLPDNDRCFDDIERLVDIATEGIDADNLPVLRQILDVEKALDYYAVSILINHGDGISNNYYLYLNTETKLFEFIPWDLDQTFSGSYAGLYHYKNGLFEQLERIPGCRDYILKRVIELFDYQEALQLAEAYLIEVESAYCRDPYLLRAGSNLHSAAADVSLYLENLSKTFQDF